MREKNVVLVGSELVKGYAGFVKMSSLLPQYNFIVFSKSATSFKKKNQIISSIINGAIFQVSHIF